MFTALNNSVANHNRKKREKNFGREFVMSHNVVKGAKSPPKRVSFDDKPLPVLASEIEINPTTQ